MHRWRARRSVGWLVAGGTLVAACGVSSAEPSESVGRNASAIIGGDASSPAQNFVVEIVQPVGALGALVCTGTLVAPNLVLTARHCVTATSGDGFSCDPSGTGTDGGALGADYDPTALLIYAGPTAPGPLETPSAHGTRFFHDDATNVCNHDVALLAIDPPLTSFPVARLDLDTKPTVGETITAVGWGVVADGGSPSMRQERGGVSILAVGPAVEALGYGVSPNEFAVGESICEGDSGGPALDASNAVIGVVSSGGNDVMTTSTNAAVTCLGDDTVNLYTELAPFREMILGAFTAVGSSPALVRVPLGEACAGSGECTSGLCAAVQAEAGTICTQSCASAACPDGFRCDVTSGKSVCALLPSTGCGVAAPVGTAAADARKRAGGAGQAVASGAFLAVFAAIRRRRRATWRSLPDT